MASSAVPVVSTPVEVSNTTHIFDTYDLFIHPHWYNFPLVPDVWHYAIGIFITVVGISGTFGNFLVIYIFGTTKSLRTPSNMFIVNLALSDLTFSAVNGFPLFSLSAFNKKWIFGKVACEFYGLVGGIFGLMSINTMAVIALDRHNVITKPIKAAHSLSYRKAFIMLVVVWVWSFVWTLPPLFGWGAYIPEGFQTSCTFDYLTRGDYFRSYILCLYICGFCIPLGVIMYCYFFIYRAVAAHEAEMGRMAKKLNAEIRQGQAQQKADIKTAKIAMTIIMTYLLSWTPYATVALIAQFGPAEVVTPYVSELPVIFAKASAMHNPVIYALSHPRFREVLNKRFPWLLCCCTYREREKESMPDTKVSRMDSVNSNAPGGAATSQISQMSDLSDSAYTSNVGEGGQRNASMKMKRMDGSGGGQGDSVESSGTLIRDILQAFVGVVNAQGQRQVPVYVPQQYMPQFAGQMPATLAAPGQPQQAIYTLPPGVVHPTALPAGAVATEMVPNPPPPPPPPVPASGRSVSQPASPNLAPKNPAAAEDGVPAHAAPPTPSPQPSPARSEQVSTRAEVNAHVNQAYQED